MIAKLLLPVFGGGASIWICSMVFFQVMLLVGYGITHWLIGLIGIRRHMVFVAVLLVSSILVMPLGIASYPFTNVSKPNYSGAKLVTALKIWRQVICPWSLPSLSSTGRRRCL